LVGKTLPDNRFDFRAIVGTAFFIGHGLAVTAAHVLTAKREDEELRLSWRDVMPGQLRAYRAEWHVTLPKSDIAVLSLVDIDNPTFRVDLRELYLGEDVQTTGLAEGLQIPRGKGFELIQRTLKGYVTHGRRVHVDLSFALPKGMSGAPLLVRSGEQVRVVGVMVGQTRVELVEDQIEERSEDLSTGTKRIERERVARVEYTARADMLYPHSDLRLPEFGGFTFAELIGHRNLRYRRAEK
jgi:hypothetical protein